MLASNSEASQLSRRRAGSDNQVLTCELLREKLRQFAQGRLRQDVEDVYVRIRKEFRSDMREALEDHRRVKSLAKSQSAGSLDSLASEAEAKGNIWHLAGYSAVKEMKEIEEYEKEIGVLRPTKKTSSEATPSHPVIRRTVVDDGIDEVPKDKQMPTPHLSVTSVETPAQKQFQVGERRPQFDDVVPFDLEEKHLPGAPEPESFSTVVPAPIAEPEALDTSSKQFQAQYTTKTKTNHSLRSSDVALHSNKALAKFAAELSNDFEYGKPRLACRRAVSRKVHCPQFDYCVGMLILMNSLSIGVQTDYTARRRTEETLPTAFRVIEVAFCALFTTELTMRFISDYDRWFSMPGWGWNVFDSLVVVAQIAEESLNIVAWALTDEDDGQGSLPNFSFMRVLRILRLIRIIRLVRILRFIGELRTLVTSILSSLKSLAWTVILLLLIIYSVSVYLTQVVRDNDFDSSLDEFYGNLLISMLTLFQSVTGGIDWNDALSPLIEEIHPLLAFVLGLYIAFTVLAVMNVVTGVFVESALLSANHDQAMYMVNNMRDLFLQANDGNAQGSMTWENFQRLLETKQMRDFFKAIDVDMNVDAARSVFHLLDMDKSGSVELDEFVTGCSRLRGQARALDLNVMLFEIREMASQMRRRFHDGKKKIAHLRRCLKTFGSTPSQGEIHDSVTMESALFSSKGVIPPPVVKSFAPDDEEERSHRSILSPTPSEGAPALSGKSSSLKPARSQEFESSESVVSLLRTAKADSFLDQGSPPKNR